MQIDLERDGKEERERERCDINGFQSKCYHFRKRKFGDQFKRIENEIER